MNEPKKYLIRVVEGSLRDSTAIARFSPKTIETFPDDPDWNSLLQITVTIDEVREIQENMTRHHHDPTPWYLDGFEVDDREKIICAFGADDGEGGRIFLFDRDDAQAFDEVLAYALSKGIPEEQMNFLQK